MNTLNSGPLQSMLRSRWLYHVGAIIVTFMYWGSGLDKAMDFAGAQAEMTHFGLNPPALYAIATIIVQLGGAALVITGGRWAWMGAGALAVFTIATIPIAHRFWDLAGDAAFMEKMVVFEHISMIGGLVLAAVAAELQRSQKAMANENASLDSFDSMAFKSSLPSPIARR